MSEMDELKQVTLKAAIRRMIADFEHDNGLMMNLKLYGLRIKLTRRERLGAWVREWRSRFGNAWLALQGAQLYDD